MRPPPDDPRRPDDDLLAAYALDAVDDPAELEALAERLASDPDARRELDAHREVAAELGGSVPVAPPPGVWEAVLAGIRSPEAPPVPLRRRSRPRLVRVAAWAAAAAALVGVGVVVGQRSAGDPDLERVAAAVAGSPAAVHRPLVAADGRPVGEIVLAADGTGFIRLEGLDDLPQDRTYQVWAMRDGTPVSVAVLGPGGRALAAFTYTGPADAFALTVEPAGGLPTPSGEPVAVAAA